VLALGQRKSFKARISKRPSIPEGPIRIAKKIAVKILGSRKMPKN